MSRLSCWLGCQSRPSSNSSRLRSRRALLAQLEDRRVHAATTLRGVGRSWQILVPAIYDDGPATGFVGEFGGHPTGAAGTGPAGLDATFGASSDVFDFGAMVWVNGNRLNGALSGADQF